MLIALHSLATMHCNLLTGIQIARETGYAGIEISGAKLKRYLAQGFTMDSLRPLLKDVPPEQLITELAPASPQDMARISSARSPGNTQPYWRNARRSAL